MDLGLDSSDDSLDIFLSDSNNSQEHPTSVSSSSTTTIATATATGRQAGHSSASRFRNPTPTGPSHANGGHYPPSSFNYNRFVPGHRRTSSENSTIPAMNVSVSRPRLSSNSLVSENASELGSQLARSHIRQQQLEGRREDWADNESTTAETSRNLVYPRRPRAQINRTLNPPRLATPPSNIRPSTSARHSAHPERPASTWEDHVAIADDNRLASEREVGRAGDSHNHGRGSLWYSRPPSPVRHGVRRRAPRDESNSNISLPSFFHSQNGAMFLRNPPSARIDATYGTLNRSSTYERRQRRDSDSSMEVDDEQLSPNHDFIPALPTPDLGDGFNQSSSLGFYSSSTRQPQVSAQVNREGQFDNYFRFEPFLSRSQDRVLESGRPSNSAQEPARRAPPTGGPLSSLDPYSFHPGPFRNTIQYMREMGGPRNTTANPPPSLPPLSLDDSNFSHSIMGNSPVLLSRIPSDSQARRSSRGVQPSPQHSEPSPVEGERATAMQHRLPIEELHMIPDADDFRDLYNESHHQHHHYHHYRNSSPRRSQPSDNVRERPGMPLFRNLDTRFFARAPTEHVPLPVFGHSRRPVRDRRRPGGDYVVSQSIL
ncbi:hypothetical protein BDQ17DRAFT_765031 [Cyathus striatus]|nr:hypothetical protein BDQ17DRAFT_765031 [Cyathus striatus]